MVKTLNRNPTFNLANDPEVSAARVKLVELQAKYAEADRQFRHAADAGDPARSAKESAIERELGNEPPAPLPNLEEARERLRVLEGAIDRQRRVVTNAERIASEKMAREALPGYSAIVRRFAA